MSTDVNRNVGYVLADYYATALRVASGTFNMLWLTAEGVWIDRKDRRRWPRQWWSAVVFLVVVFGLVASGIVYGTWTALHGNLAFFFITVCVWLAISLLVMLGGKMAKWYATHADD